MAAKITAEVGRAIRAAKKAGSSNIDCVAIVRERFGIVVDRRSIDRYLAQAVTKPATSARKTASVPSTGPDEGPVDELADLESAVRRIKGMLRAELTAREVSMLNAELRQTHAQIRAVKADAKGGKATGPDVSELRKQLMQAFAPTGGVSATQDGEEVEADDRPEVPDVEMASGASSASA